jgi:hypothetical protein
MKKLLLIALVLISTSLFSQELIGKVQFIKAYQTDEYINIHYRDLKFQQIEVLKDIYLTHEEFHNLFDVIIEGFSRTPLESITIETENDFIRLHFYKFLGANIVEINQMVNKNTNVIGLSKGITKKQVIKLFGKR